MTNANLGEIGVGRRGSGEKRKSDELETGRHWEREFDPFKDLRHRYEDDFSNGEHAYVRRHAKAAVRVFDVIGVAVDYRHRAHKEDENDAKQHERYSPGSAMLAQTLVGRHGVTIARILETSGVRPRN